MKNIFLKRIRISFCPNNFFDKPNHYAKRGLPFPPVLHEKSLTHQVQRNRLKASKCFLLFVLILFDVVIIETILDTTKFKKYIYTSIIISSDKNQVPSFHTMKTRIKILKIEKKIKFCHFKVQKLCFFCHFAICK